MQSEHFIGHQLVIRGTLQRNKLQKEALHGQRPSIPAISTAGLRRINIFGAQKVESQLVKSATANTQLAGRRNGIKVTRIKVIENPTNEIGGKSVDQLFVFINSMITSSDWSWQSG